MFQTHNRKLSAQGTPSPYAHHLFWYLQKWSAKANSGACPTRLPSFCQSDQEHLTQGSDLSWQTMGNSKTLKNTVLFLTHVRIYSTYLSLKNHRTSNFMRNKTTGKKWNTEGKYYENTINKYIKNKKKKHHWILIGWEVCLQQQKCKQHKTKPDCVVICFLYVCLWRFVTTLQVEFL